MVDLIDALKNGKNIDAVSSAVKEVVAKGVDGEDITAVLNEVLTILVDLTWDENKKLISSKSGKSSKKSSDDPVTTTQATEGPTRLQLPLLVLSLVALMGHLLLMLV